MRATIFGAVIFLLSLFFSLGSQANEAEGAKNADADTVRKTCECVRRHPNGFPYIEPRVVTCKVTRNGQVKSQDCMNCYALCSDKPAG